MYIDKIREGPSRAQCVCACALGVSRPAHTTIRFLERACVASYYIIVERPFSNGAILAGTSVVVPIAVTRTYMYTLAATLYRPDVVLSRHNSVIR